MCLTIKLLVSRPLVSALASAFLSRFARNSADLTGQRALETPNCLPTTLSSQYMLSIVFLPSMHPRTWRRIVLDGLRTLSGTASAPSISPHWDRLVLGLHILEVGEGALELPAVDGLGGFAGVLEGDTEVGAASCSNNLFVSFGHVARGSQYRCRV